VTDGPCQPGTGIPPSGTAVPGHPQAGLATVLREWGRIGCTGFGGPPAHIALLRRLCVDRRGWLDAREFEDAIAVCNLLPGPASTQLAIFCAWRVRGRLGALAGGIAFIVPGLVLILALSVLFLGGTPPAWVQGAGAGAGAAVAAVAVQAGWSLTGPSWKRAAGSRRARWIAYLLAGGAAAATIGPWLVLVLLGCGVIELAVRHRAQVPGARAIVLLPLLAARAARAAGPARAIAAAAGAGVLLPVAWTALKVGALSFGGGFVIIPLMQADATSHHWMTSAQFLNGVALGQITPGPVVQTVATVGGYRRRPARRPDRVLPVLRFRARRRPPLRRPPRQPPRAGLPRWRRPRSDRRDPRVRDPARPRPVPALAVRRPRRSRHAPARPAPRRSAHPAGRRGHRGDHRPGRRPAAALTLPRLLPRTRASSPGDRNRLRGTVLRAHAA
jgi:chromate transporter